MRTQRPDGGAASGSPFRPDAPGATAPRRSRAVWAGTLADQVLSGASNVLAVVLVARVLDPDDFGRFSLAYAALVLTLGLTRLWLGNRLVLAADDAQVRSLTGALLGTVVLLSPVMVLAVLAVSLLAVGSGSTGLVLVVALVTPVVCAQDLVRLACAATGRPTAALVSDGAWVAVMAVAAVSTSSALSTPTGVLGVWAGAAVLAAALALGLAGQRPRLATGLEELRRRDAQGTSLAVGGAVSSLASLALLWLLARLGTDAGAGRLRGASALMGPVNVLFAFSAAGVTSALVRRPAGRELRFCGAVAGALTACCLVWGAVLLALPAGVGTALLGESWTGVRSVLPWTVLEYALLSLSAAAAVGLRARQRGRSLRNAQLLRAVVTVGAGGLALLLGAGVVTVAAVLALAAGAGSAWAWVRLLAAVRDVAAAPAGPAGATAVAPSVSTGERAAARASGAGR